MCVCVMVLTQAWRRGNSTNKDLQHAQREEWNLFCSFQSKSFQYEKKIEVGSLELEKGLKLWVSGVNKWPEKGDLEGGTYPFYLPM